MTALYNALWYPALPFALIAGGGLNAVNRRERLGSTALPSNAQGAPRIWLHAASVGEVEAVRPVALGLLGEYPGAMTVVTTMTSHRTRGRAATHPGRQRDYQLAPLDCASARASVSGRRTPASRAQRGNRPLAELPERERPQRRKGRDRQRPGLGAIDEPLSVHPPADRGGSRTYTPGAGADRQRRATLLRSRRLVRQGSGDRQYQVQSGGRRAASRGPRTILHEPSRTGRRFHRAGRRTNGADGVSQSG